MDLGMYLSGLPAHAGPMACVFLAAFLQSITGFGLVMVAVPLLMFFYEPKLTIVIMSKKAKQCLAFLRINAYVCPLL